MRPKKPKLSLEEQRAKKFAYDKERRAKKGAEINAKKMEAYYRDKEKPEFLEKLKAIRKERYPKHLEYIARPEYKAKKQAYDKPHRAKRFHGEWGECMGLIYDISLEVIKLVPSKYDRSLMRGTVKRQLERKYRRMGKEYTGLIGWEMMIKDVRNKTVEGSIEGG